MARTKSAPTASAPAAETPAPASPDTPVTLTGNLTRDPVLRRTAKGIAVANLRLAVNHEDGTTTFHSVVAWKRNAEVIVQYLKKGRLVEVTGFPRERTWTDQDGNERTATEINAFSVQFVSRQASAQAAQQEVGA